MDKERDQRDSHVARRDADFEEVLEEIDAAIVGVGVMSLNSVRLWRKTLVLHQPIKHSHVIFF